MGLADVATNVMTPVAAAVPGLTWEVSTRAQAQHASPPRVLWVPLTGAYSGARKDRHNPRNIYTWRQSVRIDVWGETVQQVESVHALVVRELHHEAHAVMTLGAGRWQEIEGAMNLGELYSFNVELQFALTEATSTTVTIDTATHDPTDTSAGDGFMDHGEQ